MLPGAAWAIIFGLIAGGPRDVPLASVAATRVRATSAEMRSLIESTALRSATVRELIARLGCTDAIVYVEITSSPQIPIARTKLVTTVSGARFLRIGINAGVPDDDRGALLGHELQHAVEIAEHDEVRDEVGVRRLYTQIGWSHGGDNFETAAAKEVEGLVRSQLRLKIGG